MVRETGAASAERFTYPSQELERSAQKVLVLAPFGRNCPGVSYGEMRKHKMNKIEKIYESYRAYCESVDCEPATYLRWRMITKS